MGISGNYQAANHVSRKYLDVKLQCSYGREDESSCTRFNKCKYVSLFCSKKINTPTSLHVKQAATRVSLNLCGFFPILVGSYRFLDILLGKASKKASDYSVRLTVRVDIFIFSTIFSFFAKIFLQ